MNLGQAELMLLLQSHCSAISTGLPGVENGRGLSWFASDSYTSSTRIGKALW